jgi:hypothetical protein
MVRRAAASPRVPPRRRSRSLPGLTCRDPQRDRLSRRHRTTTTVTQAALADLQSAISEISGAGWPSPDDPDRPSEPQVEIAGDHINPRLRLFYGSPRAPIVELTPPILLNSVLYEQA